MAPSNETLKLLAQLIGQIDTHPQASSQSDLAKTILLRSQIDFDAANFKSSFKKGGGGPSVVSRIFDLLSRPNYGVANAAEPVLKKIHQHDFAGALGEMAPWKGIPRQLEGWSGKDKTTFTKMFMENPELIGEDIPGPVRAGLGLTADIGLDPTTYIGPGAIKGVFNLIRGGSKAAKGLEVARPLEDVASAERASAIPQQLNTTTNTLEAVQRATSAVPEGGTAIPAIRAVGGVRQPVGEIKWSRKAQIGRDVADVRHEYTGEVRGFENLAPPGPAGQVVTKAGKPVIEGQRYGAAFSSHMRQAREQANIAKSPGFFGQVQRAEQLVERISRQSDQAIAAAKPKPPVERIALRPQEVTLARLTARQVVPTLKVGKDKALNPKQQLSLLRGIMAKTEGGTPKDRLHRAVGMLRSAEKYLESQGYSFKYWDGTGIRLTSVLDEMGDLNKIGPDVLKEFESGKVINPALDQSIEAARARSAMDDASMVKLALDRSTQQMGEAATSLSHSRQATVAENLVRQLNQGLRGAGVSPAARSTGNALFRDILNSTAPPMQRAMSSTQRVAHDVMNRRASVASKVSREEAINHAIEAHMGSKFRTMANGMGNRNKVIESLGVRFAAHYGYSDLRPLAQDATLGAQARAGARHRTWRELVKATTPQVRREAFAAAQRVSDVGRMPAVAPEVAAVAQRFQHAIENLFSSTGIRDTAESVATRAAFTMEDMNAELRRLGSEFQFQKGKITDELTGEVKDYSNDVDWLKSWETYKLGDKEDAIEFISKLETASEKVAARYGLLDDAAARYSQIRRTGPFQYLVADPRLAGRYFTKEAAQQINRMNEALKASYEPKNAFIRFVDRVTSAWKSGVTIYAPSHHIRNLIGDIWLSWAVGGVNNPKSYMIAARILRSQRSQYGDAMAVERLVNQNAEAAAATRKGRVAVRNKDGFEITDEQIYIGLHRRGLFLNARQIEDIYAEPLMPKVFGGHLHNFVSGAAELREHFVRMGHAVDIMRKSRGKNLKEILDNAAHEVRRVHPDGMDLTGFERKYLRRIFPFYSWQRKAFPLVLESMVMRPGKIVAYPKAMEALQAAMGIEGVERTDPFPEDQLFPKWIKEKGIGPIAASGMGGIPGLIAGASRQGVDKTTGQDIGGYTIVNPSNPMVDLLSQFGGGGSPREPLQALGSGLHPGLRIPIEVTTDQQMYTGIPVSYDPARYATEQVPGAAFASRIGNVGIGGATERGSREGVFNSEAFINYLTAAGLMGTGPYAEQGRREQQARTSEQRKKAKEKFLRGGS